MKNYIILLILFSSYSYGFLGNLISKKIEDITPTNNVIAKQVTHNIIASKNIVTIEINGMVCAFCAQGIEKNLLNHPAVNNVSVDLENKMVSLSLLSNQHISTESITTIINGAGYSINEITYE